MDGGVIPVFAARSAMQMRFQRGVALQELVQLTLFNVFVELVSKETENSALSRRCQIQKFSRLRHPLAIVSNQAKLSF